MERLQINLKQTGSDDRAFNDLTKIRGLDPAKRQWLQETFNVQTISDLVYLSSKKDLFKDKNKRKALSEYELEEWIAQAQKLIIQESSWQTSANFVVSLQNRTVGDQVEHRTAVYFIEADRKATWPGVEFNGVYELMLEHLQQSYQEDRGEPVTRIFWPKSELENAQSESSETHKTTDVTTPMADMILDDLRPEMGEVEHSLQLNPDLTSLAQSEVDETFGLSTEEEPEPSTEESSESPPDEKADTGESIEGSESTAEEMPVVDKTGEEKALTAESPITLNGETPHEEALAEPLKLEITQIKVYLPPEPDDKAEDSETKDTEAEDAAAEKVMIADVVKRILMGKLPKATPLDLEVTFQLTGRGALELTRQPLSYHAEMYGENRTTHQKLTLGNASVGTLVDGELTYTRRLADVILPGVGTYRLQFLTRLENALVSPDLLELPFVQVA